MDDVVLEWLNERHRETQAKIEAVRIETITELKEINESLKIQNGRLRKAENNISVLQWAYGLAGGVGAWLLAHLPTRG